MKVSPRAEKQFATIQLSCQKAKGSRGHQQGPPEEPGQPHHWEPAVWSTNTNRNSARFPLGLPALHRSSGLLPPLSKGFRSKQVSKQTRYLSRMQRVGVYKANCWTVAAKNTESQQNQTTLSSQASKTEPRIPIFLWRTIPWSARFPQPLPLPSPASPLAVHQPSSSSPPAFSHPWEHAWKRQSLSEASVNRVISRYLSF